MKTWDGSPIGVPVRQVGLGRRHKANQAGFNLASNLISALRALDTGQFFFASLTIRAKVASSRFGT
jgi:hypothetical protein